MRGQGDTPLFAIRLFLEVAGFTGTTNFDIPIKMNAEHAISSLVLVHHDLLNCTASSH